MGTTFTDFLGQQIQVGDHVVYATTSGRSPVQKLARVEVIKEESGSYRIGVRAIKNGRGFRQWSGYDHETREFNPAKNRISYPMIENMVKVTPPEQE